MGKSKLKVLIQKRVQKLDLEEALVVYPGTAVKNRGLSRLFFGQWKVSFKGLEPSLKNESYCEISCPFISGMASRSVSCMFHNYHAKCLYFLFWGQYDFKTCDEFAFPYHEQKDEGSDVIAEGLDTLENMANELNEYVMIVLKGSEPMAFGETEEPAAYGELVSIGGLTPDVNKKLSAAISAILETKLSVPKSRFLLKF
ncbi:hypothetical protein RHMOL_Rhmol12G0013700 [Rhododendron molle]|uniref:Uncharacterized protein n=2 Tax=Rhododendron molle TaxID=49168 RepID=A0ACC0LDQ7_RHOML|nr:hypothetical protein RHMOL_Rhmol12G0013700 [Rhododendron molle]KAI8526666.1 hypothetical protein RHMOL_Rhmol12G0013700 [Rhododendron molle]